MANHSKDCRSKTCCGCGEQSEMGKLRVQVAKMTELENKYKALLKDYEFECEAYRDECIEHSKTTEAKGDLEEEKDEICNRLRLLDEKYHKLVELYKETEKRNEELEMALLQIGDMAVVDWDDKVVGEVDKVVANTTYKDRYIAHMHRHNDLVKENKELKQQLAEALGADIPSSDGVENV